MCRKISGKIDIHVWTDCKSPSLISFSILLVIIYSPISSLVDHKKHQDSFRWLTCLIMFRYLVKHKRTDSSGVAPLKSNGSTFTDPTQQATVLNQQFESVFS